jgi:hypothetical protein
MVVRCHVEMGHVNEAVHQLHGLSTWTPPVR